MELSNEEFGNSLQEWIDYYLPALEQHDKKVYDLLCVTFYLHDSMRVSFLSYYVEGNQNFDELETMLNTNTSQWLFYKEFVSEEYTFWYKEYMEELKQKGQMEAHDNISIIYNSIINMIKYFFSLLEKSD